jgi:serine protease Do
VPSNIVSKVVADLRKYGAVQRAFLGVNITDVSSDLAAEQNLKTKTGVYVIDVVADGAAEESGIKKGDVIVKIDGNSVTKTSELLEQIGRKRPGDLAEVSVFRGNEERLIKTTLKNQQGTTELFSKEDIVTEEMLGGKFEALSAAEKQKWNLRSGVKVADVGNGKLKKAGVPNDFIIVRVNNQTITSVEMLNNLLKSLNKGDGVLIQGYRPNGQADYFAFGM